MPGPPIGSVMMQELLRRHAIGVLEGATEVGKVREAEGKGCIAHVLEASFEQRVMTSRQSLMP
ncbi:hypothetical protein D3C80_1818840 [compost metagenome]